MLQYCEQIIFLGQNIDEEFNNQIVTTMLYLDNVDSTKLMYLNINCQGGDVCPNTFSILFKIIAYGIIVGFKIIK